ncbi:MAG: hypothetical protein AAF957_12010 [Planctomycetota bacterium]
MADADSSLQIDGARRRVSAILLVTLLVALGLRPFLPYHDAVPLQRDSLTWIERTDPASEDSVEWMLRSEHFIGYRPATAVSFAVGHRMHGYCERGFRGVDLGMHATAILLVLLVGVRVFGVLPGALGALLFAAHPAADEVVPFLARRSYAFATAGAFLGLLLATYGARRGVVAFALTGPALLLGMFAHELGALQALALPVVTLACAAHRGRAALLTAWGWAWIAAGAWIRSGVMRDVEGYPFGDDRWGRAGEVMERYGASLGGVLLADGPWLWVSVIAGALALVAAVQLAFARRPAALALAAVLLAYGAVVSYQAVWFPRQAYCSAAVGALFVAALGRDGVLREGASAGSRALAAVPLAAVLVTIVAASPLWRGAGPERLARAYASTAFVQGARDAAATIEGPADLGLVARIEPVEPTPTGALLPVRKNKRRLAGLHRRIPFLWLQHVLEGTDVKAREMVYVVGSESEARLVTEGGASVELGADVVAFDARAGRAARVPERRRTVELSVPRNVEHEPFLWSNLDGPGVLVPWPR